VASACTGLVDRELIAKAAALCAAASEHLLFVGPPVAAKTKRYAACRINWVAPSLSWLPWDVPRLPPPSIRGAVHGVVTIRHNSRLHHIGVGRRHAGTKVLVLVLDLHIRVLSEDGELLRELTLDPGRDYQGRPQV
jgi:hypothetical protein